MNSDEASVRRDRRRHRRHRRLREELADASVSLPEDRFLAEGLVEELDYARFPPVHEGVLPTYGSVVMGQELDGTEFEGRTIALGPRHAAVLRRLADGRHSFVLRRPNGLELLLLDTAHDREAPLVDLRDRVAHSGAAIVQRQDNGRVRCLTGDGIFTWDGAHWAAKPYASSFARTVLARCPAAPDVPLRDLLDFCVHTMGPAESGATLVWSLRASRLSEVPALSASSTPTPVPPLPFSGLANRSAIRQLLSQVDGAAILDNDGRMIAIGAQLRSSATSHEQLRIDPALGTRHASALRYSFDHPDTIEFVVSRDGPVSVYAKGEEISSIHTRAADSQTNP